MSITAKELRELAETNRPTVIKSLTEEVLKQLRESAARGKTQDIISFSESTEGVMISAVLSELEARGFKVSKGELNYNTGFPKNYTVSWADAV